MNIGLHHHGRGWEIKLDQTLGTVYARDAAEIAAVVQHYLRPEGFAKSHIEGTHRRCPLCARMRDQDRYGKRDGKERTQTA